MAEMELQSRGAVARALGGDKIRLFALVVGAVLGVDLVTKLLIQQNLHLYQQVPVIGDYVRLTYIHNPGAAFGIHLGEYSRVIFMALSVVALVALGGMYLATPAEDRVRLMAISLICGGALGNLVDRVRSPQGVVDFLDFGIGNLRWPVFNVADVAVTAGAIFLALSLWREEREDGGGRG